MNKFQIEIANRILEIEIDGLAQRASGYNLARYGDTSVLNIAQLGVEKEGLDFFPLTCEYQERYYAAGKIKGSRFIKREGRPSDVAILISRMIDRALRPLFPKDLRKEVQIISTCFSWDGENDPAILGLLGSSISLLISEIPWDGPIAAVRIGKIGDKFIINPTYKEREESELDLIISAVLKNNNELLVNMLDGKGEEISEETIMEAVNFAKPVLKKLIDFQNEIAQKLGKAKISNNPIISNSKLETEVKKILKEKLEEAFYQKDTQLREIKLNNLKEELLSLVDKYPQEEQPTAQIINFFTKAQEELLKKGILEKEKRPDDRGLDEIRTIESKTGILPRTHGSGFFARDLTRVISILTLGGPSDQQLLEGMEIVGKKRFLHHYNFPSYSVGEVGPLRGPGRREIGHGMLVEKALSPVLPDFDEFPYTIRIVSEILSSNGSTSMASVCASSLALMDGGVPIKRPVAGIAIGLVGGETNNFKLLTDIQGPEDSFGEMDFKVAGTKTGITVIQMDTKISGISDEILKGALSRAKKARDFIIEKIETVLERPKEALSIWAPRVKILEIDTDKIGLVIGPSGRTINEITTTSEVMIDIEQTGKIYITGENDKNVNDAAVRIKNLIGEVKIGDVFDGKVKKILDFGAIVEFLPSREGLVHISQFVPYHVQKLSDILSIGDTIKIKVIGVDELGRIAFSAREAGFKSKIKPKKYGEGKQ